jgi:aspartate aminotransferase
MRTAFEERQRFVVAKLNEMPGVHCAPSDGTFYAFPDVREAIAASDSGSDVELCAAILEHAGVALVPGSAFASPGFLRLSFAASLPTLQEALTRIERYLATACAADT